MIPLKENKSCYAAANQRQVLFDLIKSQILADDFFLTGGTALSVFYFYHRISNDLDFFTTEQVELSDIAFQIRKAWPANQIVVIRESPQFVSMLINGVKCDLVTDHLSFRENRRKYSLESGVELIVDSLRNINSNKFCAVVSRTEPKDFIDFYYMNQPFDSQKIESAFSDALKKEAMFEDPPTVSFQIEEGLLFLKKNPQLFPKLFIEFSEKDFYRFFQQLTGWLYQKI